MRRMGRIRALLPGTLLAVALLAGASLVLHSSGAVSSVAAQTIPCDFVADGETAGVGWDNGTSYGLVFVTRGGCRAHPTGPPLNPFAAGNRPDTYLYYLVVGCCGQAVQYGEGAIPSADLQGGGTSRLVLRTDTSAAANPAFYRYDGAGGVVALDWEPDQSYTIRSTGQWMGRLGSFSFRWHGTSLSSAARVQGSVVGATVSGPFWVPPSMGTSHDVRFEMLREGR